MEEFSDASVLLKSIIKSKVLIGDPEPIASFLSKDDADVKEVAGWLGMLRLTNDNSVLVSLLSENINS